MTNPQLRAHALVPQFRKCFRTFHAESVRVQVFRIGVAVKQLLRTHAGHRPHGDAGETHHVTLA